MELGGLDLRDDDRPDAGGISDRAAFAEQLTRARHRAGKSIRALARDLDQPAATIGGYFSGQHLPGVAQTGLFRELLRQLGITDGEAEVWVDALARVRRKPGPRPSGAPVPYRGLEPFRTEDATWFFGREELTDAVVRRAWELVKDPDSGTVLAVVGPSGSGKSSILRAGVVPAVLEGRTGFGSGWQSVVVCPGADPRSRLEAALAEVTGQAPTDIEEAFSRDSRAWPVIPGEGGLVVVVDQFEEVFTSCSADERRLFLAVLAAAGAARHGDRGRVVVVLGLRADFYAAAAAEPALVPVLQDNQLVVGPMSVDDLRRAICEPARRAGVEVEDDLVDLLVAEVTPRRPSLASGSTTAAHEPGALPLLSHALLETWERARRGRLTVGDYQATGGIAGAVQQTAERLFEELSDEERALTRRLFLRLVNVDDEFVVTRRRLGWGELPGGEGGSVENVVDRFVAHRLLTVEADCVEVSHEALLNAWPRLREWADADRAGLRVHRQLGEAARLWVEHDRDPASLLRGARLEGAHAWASSVDHRDDLNDIEAAFLDASLHHADREESASRRRSRLLQGLLVFMAVLALVAASLAAVAVRARTAANQTRDVALSRQLAIQATRLRASDPSLATQLALTAYRVAPTVDARSALLDSSALPAATRLLGQPGSTALALSADGGTFAASRAIDGTVQLFSVQAVGPPARRGVVPAAAPDTRPYALAFNGDGSMLAVGGTDKAVRLWDVSDLSHPRSLGLPLAGFTGAVQTVAFSSDGRTLAAGGEGDGVLRWDVSDRQRPLALAPLPGMTGITQTVAFSPDGGTLAAGGSDGVLRLWRDGGPAPVELATGNGTTINSAAFSPDGRLLAAGSKDKTIRIWSLADGAAPQLVGPPLAGFGSWVNTLTFSDDGTMLAGGSSDNTIRFWSVDGWRSAAPTLTSPAPVTGVRFLPDGRVLSAGEDGAARVWNWPGAYLSGAQDTVFGLSYSADGRRLAVFPNRGDDRVRIWDVSDRGHPVLLGAAQLPADAGLLLDATGTLSHDGRLLAAGTRDGAVQLFDVTDPAHVVVGPVLTGLTGLVEQVAFSQDNSLVIASSDDGSVRIWDRAHPNAGAISTIAVADSLVLGMALSPDGRLLATASADKRVRVWDVSTPSSPVPLATVDAFDNYAYSVAFSPDGTLLAAGSADKTLRLWSVTDPRHPQQLGGALTGPTNYVYSVGFDPDGRVLSAAVTDGTVWRWDVSEPARPKVLATLTAASTGQVFVVAADPAGATLAAGDDKAVHLWNTDPDAVVREACGVVGDPITRKEWAQYLPGQAYRPPCR